MRPEPKIETVVIMQRKRLRGKLAEGLKEYPSREVLHELPEELVKPYEYLRHILAEFVKHAEDIDASYLDDLLPWAGAIPDICRKPIFQIMRGKFM